MKKCIFCKKKLFLRLIALGKIINSKLQSYNLGEGGKVVASYNLELMIIIDPFPSKCGLVVETMVDKNSSGMETIELDCV